MDWLWDVLGFVSLLMVVSSVTRFLRVYVPFFDRLLSVSDFMLIFHGFCLLSLLSRDPSFWFSSSSTFLTSLNFSLSSSNFPISPTVPLFSYFQIYPPISFFCHTLLYIFLLPHSALHLSSTTLCSTSFFYHSLLYIFLDRLQLYSFKLFHHLLHHLVYYKLI